MTSYPKEPGWRRSAIGSTSREAALAAKPHAPRMADLALGVILAKGRATPEEITAALALKGQKVLLNSVRARCTQMHRLGLLTPSGEFGKGESGRCRVIRWAPTPKATAAAPSPGA